MEQVIEPKVWEAKGAARHARSLLGKYLVRRGADGRCEGHLITEVEAYDGERDLACHAARGRTARTEILYGAGGRWYVYLCYGIHEMLNLVVGPADWPSAILIRGLAGISGPGRLTCALGIGRQLNGLLAGPASGLWLEDRRVVIPLGRIGASPRIGVDYAGPIWAAKRWRFTFASAAGPGAEPMTPRSAAGSRSASRRPSQN